MRNGDGTTGGCKVIAHYLILIASPEIYEQWLGCSIRQEILSENV